MAAGREISAAESSPTKMWRPTDVAILLGHGHVLETPRPEPVLKRAHCREGVMTRSFL